MIILSIYLTFSVFGVLHISSFQKPKLDRYYYLQIALGGLYRRAIGLRSSSDLTGRGKIEPKTSSFSVQSLDCYTIPAHRMKWIVL